MHKHILELGLLDALEEIELATDFSIEKIDLNSLNITKVRKSLISDEVPF